MSERQLKVIGFTCGIGSMLVGARLGGFEVVGNVEWRKYYHTGTFQRNFPGAFMVHDQRQVPGGMDKFRGIDYAVGHPECGNFSNLRINKGNKLEDPGDIPLFVEMVRRVKPRFFLMDDLPNSFVAYPMSKYSEELPEYDLFPEWVSNWGYGNVQKNRDRFFMIGALKTERFTFRPGEAKHEMTVQKLLGDLMDPATHGRVPNHHAHDLGVQTGRGMHLRERGHRATWGEVKEWFEKAREGQALKYYAADGLLQQTRMGLSKPYWEGHSHVLTGTNPIIHPKRCDPFSIRERARIQGFPDDFVFEGEVVNEDGTWNHDKNNKLVKQTGKAMPVHFCAYVARQVRAHILGEPFECSGERLLKPNGRIDSAKRWFCEKIGYADQPGACSACWMSKNCGIRYDKYRIGPAPRQMYLPAPQPPAPTQVGDVAEEHQCFDDDSAG